jgi:hypothetical protein
MGPRTTAGWRSGSGSFFFMVLADYARLYGKRRMCLGRDCAPCYAAMRSGGRSFVCVIPQCSALQVSPGYGYKPGEAKGERDC